MPKYLLLGFLIFFTLGLHAQPKPCVDPKMTSLCVDACVICDINGFTGINNSNIQGQAPPGFCTTKVHHMQWIAFIAGSTNLTLAIDVKECQGNNGLEIGIYGSLNCQSFQLMSNCDTDVGNNSTGTIKNTIPLVVGQYYFLVMDGSDNDICKYTVRVVSGSTLVTPLITSGEIRGVAAACPGITTRYALNIPKGATAFQWNVDGAVVGRDSVVLIPWKTLGDHQLCVTAFNACDTAAPVCRTIRVEDIPPTVVEGFICPGECFKAQDSTFCASGNYDFRYKRPNGCDSVVQVRVTAFPATVTNLALVICKGDSVSVGGRSFYQTGKYERILQTVRGCDSIIRLDLQVVVCEIRGNIALANADCFGRSSGALRFSISDATPPLKYVWTRIGPFLPSGTGAIGQLNTPIQLNDLPIGTYFVTITDNFGNDLVLFGEIKQPPILLVETTSKQYNGFNLSCQGGNDGQITARASGGTPPFLFRWSNGDTTELTQQLIAGTYSVTATDANGCTSMAADTLKSPPRLLLSATFTNPNCDGFATGSIAATAAGGVADYRYDLSANLRNTDGKFTNLTPGLYRITATDTNGCTADSSRVLQPPLIPVVALGLDTALFLGDSIHLQWSRIGTKATWQWTPAEGLSCADCAEPFARPVRTTQFVLTATSSQGCIRADSITVAVRDRRRVYAPNVFSPNNDGVNDFFVLSSGNEVLRINTLQIFSRWGELVFQNTRFPPNAERLGWGGDWRGRELPAGLFVWMAEVEFIDGVKTVYKGDVLLLR